MKKTVIVSALVSVIVAVACVEAVTHIVLTNDQNFTVANGRSLTGTYECSGAGTISSCVTSLSSPTITSPTVTGGTLSGTNFIKGSFGRQSVSGDGVFTCAGSFNPSVGFANNNCYFGGNYFFNGAGGGVTEFDSGFSVGGSVNFGTGTTSFAGGTTLDISGTLTVNTLATLSVVKTVRASGGAADCNLTFTKGLLTASTC